MISNETRQTILSLHKTGCKIRHISRILEVSRNTVRDVIRGNRKRAVKTHRHQTVEPLILEHFAACKQNAVRIQEILGEQYNQKIPYSSLTRIVRDLELRDKKATKRSGSYEFGPGEEMQHDTSPHQLILAGKKIKAQCASLTFGYSRKIFAQYYPCFTRFEAKVFLTGAFLYMKGTCDRCIIDNTSVVVAHGSGPDAVMAPEMGAFGRMFGTTFVAHVIGDADRKAKAERNFHYIENNFLAGRRFESWADVNKQARDWCDGVANAKPKRSLGRMSPDEVYVLEKPHLNPLPAHIPPVYKTLQRVVDISGFVTVDTNRYSVPEALCGQKVEVLKSFDRIEIYHKYRSIARHERLMDKRDGKVIAKGHHQPVIGKKGRPVPCREEQSLTGRHLFLDEYVTGLKKNAYGGGRRKLQKLLDLKRTYPAEAFKKGVEQALHYGLYDLVRLENLILSFVAGDFFNLQDD